MEIFYLNALHRTASISIETIDPDEDDGLELIYCEIKNCPCNLLSTDVAVLLQLFTIEQYKNANIQWETSIKSGIAKRLTFVLCSLSLSRL